MLCTAVPSRLVRHAKHSVHKERPLQIYIYTKRYSSVDSEIIIPTSQGKKKKSRLNERGDKDWKSTQTWHFSFVLQLACILLGVMHYIHEPFLLYTYESQHKIPSQSAVARLVFYTHCSYYSWRVEYYRNSKLLGHACV